MLSLIFLIVVILVLQLLTNVDIHIQSKPKEENVRIITQRRIPINIPTRGETPAYKQIGSLHEKNPSDPNKPMILPVYGAPTYRGSSKWLYYTYTDQYNKVKLPIYNEKQKNCQNEYGCNELNESDNITINAYSREFEFRPYEKMKFRYIPYIQ